MNPTIFHWRSLNTRITLFTLAIFLISIWSLAFYASQVLRQDMERILGDQQVAAVSLLARELDHELSYRMRVLGLIAGKISPAMLGNATALQAFLEEHPLLQDLFNAGVIAFRLDGTVLAWVPLSSERIAVHELDIDTVTVALREGKSTIGRPVMGKKLQAVFHMTVPIGDQQGKVIGALAGVVDLGLPNSVDQITQSHYGKTGGYVLVAPQYRLIITATDKSRVMATLPAPGINPTIDRFIEGFEGPVVYVGATGVELLTSAKRIPVAGWDMLAILPTAEAFAPIHAMQQHVLLTTVGLTLLVGFLIWWMLQRQLSPLLAAARKLASASDAKDRLQPLPIFREDEIGQLIGGFNHLLAILAEREDALQQSEAFKNAILNSIPAEIAVLDRDGMIVMVNQPWICFALENSIEDGKPAPRTGVGVNYLSVCQASMDSPSQDAAIAAYHGIRAVLDGSLPSFTLEYRCDTPEQRQWFSMVVSPLTPAGQGAVVSHTNINERKQAEVALREKEEFFRLIAENLQGFVAVLDVDGRRLYNSPSYARLFGERDISGTSSFADIHPADRERVRMAFRDTVATGIGQHLEFRILMADGGIRLMESRAGVIRGKDGRTKCVVVVSHDVTERKENEEKIHRLAFYDALTQLPNRLTLNDRLRQAMATNKRSGYHGALMFLDLDNFKPVNDTYGHEVGDLLLIEVADRLKTCIRAMDTVARFGGDEFVVMLSDLHADEAGSIAHARIVAEKIRLILSEPYRLTVKHEGKADTTIEHRCTASIGIALFRDHEASRDDILKWADTAMYQAKEAGGNRIRFFDAQSS